MNLTELEKKKKKQKLNKKTKQLKTKQKTDRHNGNFVRGFVNVPPVHTQRRCHYRGNTFEEPLSVLRVEVEPEPLL